MALKEKRKAPAFSLPDQDGKMHSLKNYLGKWVLIYFYPKDDTPGCTKEACAIRDSFPDFKKLKITVLGISVDSVKSHSKFALKHTLPFTILSDENKEVVQKYDVWGTKKFMGRVYTGTLRTSFLIDPSGKIGKVYADVNPVTHAQDVLNDFKVIRKTFQNTQNKLK